MVVNPLIFLDLFFAKGADSRGVDAVTFEEPRIRRAVKTNTKTSIPVNQYDFRSDGVIVMYFIH